MCIFRRLCMLTGIIACCILSASCGFIQTESQTNETELLRLDLLDSFSDEGGYLAKDSNAWIANNCQRVGPSTLVVSNGNMFKLVPGVRRESMSFLCAVDEYIYCCTPTSNEGESWPRYERVYSYHVPSNVYTYLFTIPLNGNNSIYYDNAGNVFFPMVENTEATIPYYVVSGDKTIKEGYKNYGYTFGDKTFFIVNDDTEDILYERIGDSAKPADLDGVVIKGDVIYLIPTQKGLVIHNQDSNNILYFVDGETGEITQLASTTALCTRSTASVVEDYVFVSYMRYEKIGEGGKGLARYSNDTLSGTYQIDLNDFTATKISDSVYTSFYIFDDNMLFAIDEHNKVTKLDFFSNAGDGLLR